MSSILEVKDLVKKYGNFTAVNGISFDIKEGEIFSLLGPNGAGKTTTISVLSTLFTPTSGDAIICGHSVRRDPMAVRNAIGVVPQELALYEDLTARENLNFWGQMYGLSGKATQYPHRRGAGADRPHRQSQTAHQDLFRRNEAPCQHWRGAAPQTARALHG